MIDYKSYVGHHIDEVVDQIEKTKIKCLIKPIANGELYNGPTFEVILVRFDPKTKLVAEVGPAYLAKKEKV